MSKNPPKCECHGEPCYWHKKKDMRAGGLWRCAVRKREVQRSASFRARQNAQRMERYDADPIYRIKGNLRVSALRRRQTIARKKEALRG